MWRDYWVRVAFGFIGTLTIVAPAGADYPPLGTMSQQQPPTREDWFRLYLRRLQRAEGMDCLARPFVFYGAIYYYPCPPDQPCGEAVHPSFRGVYGIRHPMPYYIANPRVEFHDPTERYRPWPCRYGPPPMPVLPPYRPIGE